MRKEREEQQIFKKEKQIFKNQEQIFKEEKQIFKNQEQILEEEKQEVNCQDDDTVFSLLKKLRGLRCGNPKYSTFSPSFFG